MVNLYTAPPIQPAPPQVYPNFSPEQLASLERQFQQIRQIQQQNQSLAPSLPQVQTSQTNVAGYGGSTGTMSTIDPALLMAQWQAMQTQNLPQNAVNYQPTYQQPQYIQQQGEYLTSEQTNAIARFVESSQNVSKAASRYIDFLEGQYAKLLKFSNVQNDVIDSFLYDRDFTLNYIRGAWIQNPIDSNLANKIAAAYMELDALFPRHKDPQYSGSAVNYQARVTDLNSPSPYENIQPIAYQQSSIPPLPNSSYTQTTAAITPEAYMAARDAGNLSSAVSAAMQNPTALYAALFQ